MGTSPREANASADQFLLKVARENPLESLTEKELQLEIAPVAIHPRPVRAQAWVRFGKIPVHLDCRVHRTTPDAAGIEFTILDKTFRCWVWGNAVTIPGSATGAAARPGADQEPAGGRRRAAHGR